MSPWKALAIGGGALVGMLGMRWLLESGKKPAQVIVPRRVALIGDSYAVGLGPELTKLFPAFKYEGHVGTNTAQWAHHSSQCGQCGDWLSTFKPDIVLVSLGVNDGTMPNPANYRTIAGGLQGLGARVIWIEPPARVPTPSRSVIDALGVSVISGTTSPLAGDALHPQSYVQWAREVAQAVANA